MGLFDRFFGRRPTMEGLRKAVADKRFAEARLLADELRQQPLSAPEAAEIEGLRTGAGDELARLNLSEALGFRSCGREDRAQEHFQLALDQVGSPGLRQEIEAVRNRQDEAAETEGIEAAPASACRLAPAAGRAEAQDGEPTADEEQRMELILASYPAELRARYLEKSDEFRRAFLASHAGNDDLARELWMQVAEAERDELYRFELGSLLARCKQLSPARQYLEAAVEDNPRMAHAVETLLAVLKEQGDFDGAQEWLQRLAEKGLDPGFCHAQQALLAAQRQDPGAAVANLHSALAAGYAEPAFILFSATLLEQNGELDEAEKVLQSMPRAGCGGGVNLPLAEFWLRQKRELGKALDAFNLACRQDPQNPRWQLRAAQTYLARGWRKEGLKLLQRVVVDPRLEPELQEDAQRLLAESGS